MAELEKVLKGVVLGSVGAVAAVVEKSGKIARGLVEKGQETVSNNQETVDNIRRKVREACERVNCDKQSGAVPDGFEMKKTSSGLQLNCLLEKISPEKAEEIQTLLEQVEAQAEARTPQLVQLDGLYPGVQVTIDAAVLPAEKRDAIRQLVESMEAQANG